MEKPGKLTDKFDDLGSGSQNEQLLWENSGPIIMQEVEKRKRRRRLVWWWFSSVAVILVVLLVYTYLDLAPAKPISSGPFLDDRTDRSIAVGQSVKEEILQYKVPNITSKELNSNVGEGMLRVLDTTNFKQKDEEQTNITKARSDTFGEFSIITKTNVDIIKEKYRVQADYGNADVNANELGDNSISTIGDTAINLYFDASDKGVISISKNLSGIDLARFRVFDSLSLLPTHAPGLFSDTKSIGLPVQVVDSEMEKKRLSAYGWFGLSVGSFGKLNLPINTSKVDYSTEIGLKYLANDNWFISAGIAVSRSSFRTEFVERNNVKLYKPNTVDTIFQYSTGESNITYRDSIIGIRTRNFGHTSRQTSYGIPLHFGYDFKMGSIVFTPELGTVFSLSQQINARIVDNDYQYQDYIETQYFNFSLAFRLGMGVSRKIGKGRIKARYLFDLSPAINLSNYTIDGFYNHIFQIGYEYDF